MENSIFVTNRPVLKRPVLRAPRMVPVPKAAKPPLPPDILAVSTPITIPSTTKTTTRRRFSRLLVKTVPDWPLGRPETWNFGLPEEKPGILPISKPGEDQPDIFGETQIEDSEDSLETFPGPVHDGSRDGEDTSRQWGDPRLDESRSSMNPTNTSGLNMTASSLGKWRKIEEATPPSNMNDSSVGKWKQAEQPAPQSNTMRFEASTQALQSAAAKAFSSNSEINQIRPGPNGTSPWKLCDRAGFAPLFVRTPPSALCQAFGPATPAALNKPGPFPTRAKTPQKMHACAALGEALFKSPWSPEEIHQGKSTEKIDTESPIIGQAASKIPISQTNDVVSTQSFNNPSQYFPKSQIFSTSDGGVLRPGTPRSGPFEEGASGRASRRGRPRPRSFGTLQSRTAPRDPTNSILAPARFYPPGLGAQQINMATPSSYQILSPGYQFLPCVSDPVPKSPKPPHGVPPARIIPLEPEPFGEIPREGNYSTKAPAPKIRTVSRFYTIQFRYL